MSAIPTAFEERDIERFGWTKHQLTSSPRLASTVRCAFSGSDLHRVFDSSWLGSMPNSLARGPTSGEFLVCRFAPPSNLPMRACLSVM